jgi:hypothetical protein
MKMSVKKKIDTLKYIIDEIKKNKKHIDFVEMPGMYTRK